MRCSLQRRNHGFRSCNPLAFFHSISRADNDEQLFGWCRLLNYSNRIPINNRNIVSNNHTRSVAERYHNLRIIKWKRYLLHRDVYWRGAEDIYNACRAGDGCARIRRVSLIGMVLQLICSYYRHAPPVVNDNFNPHVHVYEMIA